MSYGEYYDMYYEAQENQKPGQPRLLVWDIKGSRNHIDTPGHLRQRWDLHKAIYDELLKLEETRKQQILYYSDELNYIHSDLDRCHKATPPDRIYREDTNEPFLVGDSFGMTVLNGTINPEEVYEIYQRKRTELSIEWDCYFGSAVYETDEWVRGAEELFRGYAAQILSEVIIKRCVDLE